MKRALVLALAVVSATAGCSSLRARQVKYTHDKGDVAPCRLIAEVKGSHFLDDAADLGADVVLRSERKLTAYDCGGRYAKR